MIWAPLFFGILFSMQVQEGSLRFQVQPVGSPGPGFETPVKVTIIYDNTVHTQGLEADWGFACFIEGAEKTILFDTGTNPDLFQRNFQKLNLDAQRVDIVVLSHQHGDHTGGLFRFLEWKSAVPVLVPFSFTEQFIRGVESAGAFPIPLKEPSRICQDVYLSGELGDRIREHCLILNTKQGLVVITGCSHPGIVSMLQHIKKILGKPIAMVFGGFHLMDKSESEMREIIQAFKDLGVRKVGATHCTGERQIEMFREAFGDSFVQMGAGKILTF